MPELSSPLPEDDLTIQALLRILKARRMVILAATCIVVGIAAIACVFMTRQYSATGEIQVGKTSSDGLGLESMMSAADSASDALDANITLQTQATILQSDTLALQVIQDLNLEHTDDFKSRFNPIGWVTGLVSPKGMKDPVGASLANSPGRRTHALRVFSARLKVAPVAGTRLIDLTYTSSDPANAAAVINDLSKVLVEYTFQTRYAATNQASEWLSGQLSDVKKEAETLQARVVKLQRDSGVYSLGATDTTGHEMAYSSTLDRLQQATQALTAAESSSILKGDIYHMVKGGDPELISGLAGNSMVAGSSAGLSNSLSLLQNLRQQQSMQAAELATDTSKYGSANPKLTDERAALASTDKGIRDEAQRIGERAANDYEVARLSERDLRAVYERQKVEANKLNDKAIEYTIARQEALDGRQLYETLYQRLKEAGVMEGLQSTNITVVNPGRVPSRPTKPNTPVYLGGSLVGGLFLGSVLVLFLEAIDDKVRSFEAVEHDLRVPLIGVLPMVGSAGAYLPSIRRRVLAKKAGMTVRPLAVIEGPGTAFTEALRCLRTTLQLSRRGEPPKVILVSSSIPGEGKSTISSNLAALLAQSGEHVLLIEGDMRRPSFSRILNTPTDKTSGLSAILAGSQKTVTYTKAQSIANLEVLCAGPIPPFPSELLAADTLRDLIVVLRTQFDRIIIDSPPLLAVTDAVIIAQFADITLLVARHDVTTRKSLRRAYRMLTADPDSHVGVVLNGVNRSSTTYEEYYGYSGNAYYAASTGGANA